MRIGLALGSTLLAVAIVATTQAADDLTSGPPVGKNIPGAFHPLNVTGSSAGQKNCLV